LVEISKTKKRIFIIDKLMKNSKILDLLNEKDTNILLKCTNDEIKTTYFKKNEFFVLFDKIISTFLPLKLMKK
jgi:hypothetical protein